MYTVIETAKLKEAYLVDNASVEDIALDLGKSVKSVIGKLVAEKIYKPQVKVSKVTGGRPKTKLEFVRDIESILEIELPDLDKAPKGTLIALTDSLREYLGEPGEDDLDELEWDRSLEYGTDRGED